MAGGLASNEPTQRVSKDNGVFDGALIGMGIGGAAGGAGVLGARAHYNGIDKRSERQLKNIDNAERNIDHKLDRIDKRFDKAQEKYGTAGSTDFDPYGRLEKKEARRQKRMDRAQKKHDGGLDKLETDLQELDNHRAMSDPKKMRSRHAYSRMGGWRNAGIIGASAVIGAGVGMVSDGLYDK